MDTTIDDPLPGALVDGRYRVHTRISRSTVATVYTAVDERLGRTVDLKIIRPAQAGDPQFVDRFTAEAGTIARLTHPNVVGIYDQGSHQGLAYLVMEHVRGRSLREVLTDRGHVEPQEALAILEQVLSAVAAAHRGGLVHRDLKPENILVAEPPGGIATLVDGVVKVTDFGLARAVEASADGRAPLMATGAYVAPELATHGHTDPRTDVYAAGIVLFEMLTGQPPRTSTASADLIWGRATEPVPPPSHVMAGLHPSLDSLVTRATNRDPAARPTDAGAMLSELQAARDAVGAAERSRSVTEQHTMVVPRMPMSPPTRPDPTYYGQPGPEAERPPWARLPQNRATAPGIPPGQPNRHASPTTAFDRVAPLVARVRRDRTTQLATIAAMTALALVAVLGVWWFAAGRYDPTPNLTGLPRDQAMTRATNAGFTIRIGTARFDAKVEKDAVVEQQPPAGTRLASGDQITIILSKGPERYEVPDVVGKAYELAERDLKDLRVTIKKADGYDDDIPRGSVISTDPAAGTEIEIGATVTVTVSKGRAPLRVPNVVGKNVNEARSTLTRMGLNVVVQVQDQEGTKPKDQVVEQDPIDGAGIDRGGTVTLTVSKGPAMVTVPDVRNMKVEDAVRALQELGLNPQPMGGGTVRMQSPDANSQVKPGSEVRLFAFG